MTVAPRSWRRRILIAGGLLAVTVWVIAAPRLTSIWPSRLTYRDLPRLTPFRALETAGALSTSAGLLVGLEPATSPDAAQEARIAAVRADLCAALFGPQTDTRLPVAFFSDFNCPNCRVLDAILLDYDAANPGTLRIIRHELPLLGAASTIASQAVLAADLQDGFQAMHDRLMRTRMVTDLNFVVAIAESVGLTSYPMYLFHGPVMMLVGSWIMRTGVVTDWRLTWALLVAVGLTVGAAGAWLLERPVMGWRAGFLSQMKQDTETSGERTSPVSLGAATP